MAHEWCYTYLNGLWQKDYPPSRQGNICFEWEKKFALFHLYSSYHLQPFTSQWGKGALPPHTKPVVDVHQWLHFEDDFCSLSLPASCQPSLVLQHERLLPFLAMVKHGYSTCITMVKKTSLLKDLEDNKKKKHYNSRGQFLLHAC